MQNAGQQYGQGVGSSHQGTSYGHTESSSSSTGSITSSLRQFRKKDVEKQQVNDTTAPSTGESHVARVAPHNHYPPRTNETYRYPSQFPDYSLSPQVKYSEITDLHPLQEPVPPSVIQKPKGKEYMDMCNVQQNHMKQSYADHLNGQQYAPESNPHPHPQYPHKDHQVHPLYKPESQYFPKDAQYQQLPHHQIQKYNMPAQMRKYPPENDFLSKLRRIHPSMARSIMSDHHMQESQPTYQSMDQSRMYPHQNQRYMNYPSSLQGNPYPHNYMPPQNYTNYPASCSYTRPPQMAPRFPSINPHERSVSPRRGYNDNLPIPPMNYATLPQKVSPNYPQYNAPEYAQHYQHRRAPQDYYQQHCRPAQYLPHQMTPQEMTESRVTVSDNIKQYIENWADEETASEMNQVENNRLCKENIRVRDDQSTETVYMINASELQYLENGIPLVTSENGIPLVASENGQYIIKSGVAIDNSTGMVRIMDKGNHIESTNSAGGERVVNLHIMDAFKPDCMLANKPNELNQRQAEGQFPFNDKPKVVIHQNTVIQPSHQSSIKEAEPVKSLQEGNKIGNSLPIITENDITQETDPLEKFEESIFKECKRETADKNCSPINVEQMEGFEDFNAGQTSVICATKPPARDDEPEDDSAFKNMPIIELLPESGCIKTEREDVASDSDVKQATHMKTEDDLNMESVDRTEDEKFTPNSRGDLSEEPQSVESTTANDSEESSSDEKFQESKYIKKEDDEKIEDQSVATEELPQSNEPYIKDENIKNEENAKSDDPSSDPDAVEKMDVDMKVEEKITDDGYEAMGPPDDLPKIINKETPLDETKKEDTDEVANLSESMNSEENLSPITASPSPSEVTAKPKRSRRIFSVDDIINNIGTNKSKSEREVAARRRSLEATATKEFLEREIDNSYIFPSRKNDEKNINVIEAIDGKEAQITDEIVEPPIGKEVETVEATENCASDTKVNEIQAVEDCKDETDYASGDSPKSEPNPDLNITQAENDLPKEEVESTIENYKTSEVLTETLCSPVPSVALEPSKSATVLKDNSANEKSLETDIIIETESEVTSVLNDDEESAQNEVHYRNAIRVEENSVLLEIAGELVEINVTTVNGKKVITVVPLSESTVVDFNDNYEPLENSEDIEIQIKTDTIASSHDGEIAEVVSVEEVVPEAEVIETTSEIIIGMDISLEEEIHLDLEKPPILCTKAAKKAYENDLQIPSITTSEDVNDNNKGDCDNVNDKVSSSKEQSHAIEKCEKKRSDKVHSSKKMHDSKQSNDLSEKRSKTALKELLKVRKIKKNETLAKMVEEEDFVPFRDLVKARNLKKQKQQQVRSSENVSADSTNRVDHDDISEECKERKDEKDNEEDVNKCRTTEKKHSESKIKDRKLKNYRKPSKIDDSAEANHNVKENTPIEVPKPDGSKVNSSTDEKDEPVEQFKEKVLKKVTFGGVDYRKPDGYSDNCHFEIRNYRLQDPRLTKRPSNDVIVPSVSELLKENAGLENSKRKLSLEEYNKRKRKLGTSQEQREVKVKKIENVDKTSIEEKTPADKFKMQRPKSLDDIKAPKEGILAKRKFSLEDSYSRPNHFDWEETQSPKTNLNAQEKNDKRLSEFSGLINHNRSKIVIDINDLNAKPMASESSEDEVLQIYKEQVDSKLSSLNIQIPRVVNKPVLNPFSTPEANNLMERFLRNDKITAEEMEKIKKIISYKRLVQQLNKIKSPDVTNPTYEIRKNCTEKDMKLHLKKVSDTKRKNRFRNLYSDSTTESDSDLGESKDNAGAYSVVQTNCLAAGVPKLIIKRKTEMPVPVVRLERLDLGLLVGKKRKIY